VIRRFRHRGLRRLYEDDDRREVNPQHADKIARILARLDVATRPEQLDLPGFRLRPLKASSRITGASLFAPTGGSF
jgi:toxin HigB-1